MANAAPESPIVIYRSVNNAGETFALDPASRERVRAAFENVRVYPRVFIAHEAKEDYKQVHADLLRQVIQLLTGVTLERLEEKFGSLSVVDPVTEQALRPS